MIENTNTIARLLRSMLYGLTNWSLFIAGIVNLVVGTWSAAYANTAIAATSLTAGLVLLFAATIDRFESLKGLGIEAKTRKLDEKIEQADDALRKIRLLAELTGKSLVGLYSMIGRVGSAPSQRVALAFVEQVRSIMLGLGSEPSVIAAALRPWARILCHDLMLTLTEPLQKQLVKKLNELQMSRHASPSRLDADNPEFLKLSEDIKKGNIYIERFRKIGSAELDDYPDCFMSLFEDVPSIFQAELELFRERAERLASDMMVLKRTMSLPDSEHWMQELEAPR